MSTGAISRFTKSDVKSINREMGLLHPVMRSAVYEVLMMCEAEMLPFQLFEAFRTPQRQHHLYLQGRIPSRPGKIVTGSDSWQSYHQFGLAVDFALVRNKEFSFDLTDEWMWTRLREIGEDYGLEGIENQPGHLQYATLEIAQLRKGSYPGGGDRSWEENLRQTLRGYPLTSLAKAPASRNASESVTP